MTNDNPLMEELQDAAFEVLTLHHGIGFEQWRDILVEQYSLEVVDALGTDPEVIAAGLAQLWQSDYTDTLGRTHTFAEWSVIPL